MFNLLVRRQYPIPVYPFILYSKFQTKRVSSTRLRSTGLKFRPKSSRKNDRSIVAFGEACLRKLTALYLLSIFQRYPELKLTVMQSSHHRNRLLDGLGGGTGGGEGGSPLDIFSGGEEEVKTVRIPFLATNLQLCRRSHNVFSPAPTATIFPFLARLLSLYALPKKERSPSPRRTKKTSDGQSAM